MEMLDKRSLVAISLFAGVLVAFEILTCISTTWYVVYAFLTRGAVCAFFAGYLVDIFGDRILKTKINPRGKAIFITGCDSGFGHNLAKRLDAAGYKVFAGCLFPGKDGAEELQKSTSMQLQVVHVDVTDDSSVLKAKDLVKANLANHELWAIVNNAGVFRGLDVELCTLDQFKFTLEVNTIGPVRVTKAFLPLLRQSKGRVVNVNSQAGKFSVPKMAAYCMSKHASLCFTNCLRKEMERWGIQVISIEPEFFQTSILSEETSSKILQEIKNELDEDFKESYGDNYVESSYKKLEWVFDRSSPKVDIVLDAIESAISLEYPAEAYKPCRNWFVQLFMHAGRNLPNCFYQAVNRYILL